MEIRWKTGSNFGVEAKVAHKEIETLRAKNDGSISADQVVSAAAKKRNPIHLCFEWDDQKAAHEHRLQTAREMLRSFVFVREDIQTDRPQRVYEVVRQPQQGAGRVRHVYKTTDDILKDEDLRAELLGRALKELISIRNRYRDLNELAVVLRAIDEVIASAESS